MKYRFILTKRFEKDVKRCVKRGLPMENDYVRHFEDGTDAEVTKTSQAVA